MLITKKCGKNCPDDKSITALIKIRSEDASITQKQIIATKTSTRKRSIKPRKADNKNKNIFSTGGICISNSNFAETKRTIPDDIRLPIIIPKSSNSNTVIYSQGFSNCTDIAPLRICADNVPGDFIRYIMPNICEIIA